MAGRLTNSNPDYPPLTARQISEVLGKSSTAINNSLAPIPATGCRRVSGNDAPEWHWLALPDDLRKKILAVTKGKGFNTVGEMIRAGEHAWQPPVKPADNDPAWTEAAMIREALRPSLLRNPKFALSIKDFEADALADYQKVFGKGDVRWVRYLLKRTKDRDGGRGDYGRLEIYLPDKLKRKAASPAPKQTFPVIDDAIASRDKIEVVKGERVVEITREEFIWECTLAEYDRLKEALKTPKRAARILCDYLAERARVELKIPNREALRKTFKRRLARHISGETPDRRYHNGRDLKEITWHFRSLGWAVPAARHFCVLSNRTHDSGSLPEALHRLMRLPELPGGWTDGNKANFLKAIGLAEVPTFPAWLRSLMLERERAGKDMIPTKLAGEIRPSKSMVKHSRSPREWRLKNMSAPGSQRRCTNPTGERVIMQPGDWFGGDDATPGIGVCVPSNEILTPCSQKFGVLLGRFQWLVYVDCRTDKIMAWDYIVRPRGSYRAEDILNGMQAVIRTHGIPRRGFQFEGGVFNARLVRQAIYHLGCEHWRTNSPHQKAVEVVFGKVWTRLAVQFPHADMGRFRAENQSNCRVYEGCKAGHLDPRKYFPTIADVVKAFDEEVKTHNAGKIFSDQYGQWVPDDFFQSYVSENTLRPYQENMAWMFAPMALERTVRGMLVSCRLPMFENFSVPFDFGAEWLPNFNGQKVRIHFNPHDPKCRATVVLVDNYGPHKAGDILGEAALIGETAMHVRHIMQWADDDRRAGYRLRQKTESYVRRETRAVGVGGRVEYSKSEERDGMVKKVTIERGAAAPAPAADGEKQSASRLENNFAQPTRTERTAKLDRLRRESNWIFGYDDPPTKAELDAEFERLNRETKPILT